jgi:chorismate mutase/prephenate dehydratase
MKVGYQGVRGAFSESAVRLFFEGREYEEECYSNFISMFRDVESGVLDYAVFPVENTTTGIIARTYDHFQHYGVHVVGEAVVPIRECLIANPGTRIEEIREVYSHPEALSQCQALFDEYTDMRPHAHEDTALSVSYIKDLGDNTKAALASELAAEIYGMEILLPYVQDSDVNMTRFFLVTGREEYAEDADKVSIRMVTGHTPGSLFNALGIFASLNINVLKLESRPIFGRVFEYCFYLDFAGNINDPDVQEALRRLQYDCVEVNVFGNYKAAMDYM